MSLSELVYDAIRRWSGTIAHGTEGGRLVEWEGVQAAVVPAVPERSVANSVTYSDPAVLAAVYDEIAAAYEAIGAVWTVWVHAGDRAAATLLEQRGHVLDAEPVTMARTLAHPPDRPALEDWTRAGSMEDVAELNDRAYGYHDSFTRMLSTVRFPGDHVYVAEVDGRAAGCLVMVDHEDNTDVAWVAVRPEARGQGLSGKLLAHALADAAERGCATSTLIATRLGLPVYERLGFERVGALEMWERRRAG